jgi:hypothetical protein
MLFSGLRHTKRAMNENGNKLMRFMQANRFEYAHFP